MNALNENTHEKLATRKEEDVIEQKRKISYFSLFILEETGGLVQGRCQRRKQFGSEYCDEKQDWGMVHLAGRAELGAWDDDESVFNVFLWVCLVL